MAIEALLTIKKVCSKNSFVHSISVLVGGTAGSQALLILASPILTRLYTPEDFGLVAVYASLLGLVAVIASLRYELAIPLPEEEIDAAHVLVLSAIIVLLVTILTAFSIFWWGDFLSVKIGMPALSGFLWLIPVGVLFAGIYKVFNYWAIRTKDFPSIARTKIYQSLAMLIIQLVGFKAGGIALLCGQVVGHGVGSSSLGVKALNRKEFKSITLAGLKQAASRYYRFPLFSSWEGFANTAGVQLPPLLFAMFFSAGMAGLYSLASRILLLPMSLVGNAVGQAFFSNAVEANRERKLALLVSNLYKNLFHIAMPPTILLILVGPDVFALIFGETWRQAGEFARWMAPWMLFVFVMSPISSLFSILERQATGFIFQFILLISRISSIGLGAYLDDLKLAIILFSSSSALCWMGLLIWVVFALKIDIGLIVGTTFESLISAIICGIPIVMANIFDFDWVYGFVPAVIITVYFYYKLLKNRFMLSTRT